MSNLRTQHGSSEPQRSPTTSGRFAEAVNATAFFIQLCQFPNAQSHMTKQSTCRIQTPSGSGEPLEVILQIHRMDIFRNNLFMTDFARLHSD